MVILFCSSVSCVPSKHSKSFKFDFRMSCFNCNIFHFHYLFCNVEQCSTFGFYAFLSQLRSSAMMTGFLIAVFRKIACTRLHWTKAGEWPFVCTLHFSVPRRKGEERHLPFLQDEIQVWVSVSHFMRSKL